MIDTYYNRLCYNYTITNLVDKNRSIGTAINRVPLKHKYGYFQRPVFLVHRSE